MEKIKMSAEMNLIVTIDGKYYEAGELQDGRLLVRKDFGKYVIMDDTGSEVVCEVIRG